jgi:hypothetical protein
MKEKENFATEKKILVITICIFIGIVYIMSLGNSNKTRITTEKAKQCAQNFYNTTGKSQFNEIRTLECGKAKYTSERYTNIKYCYLALYGPDSMEYYVAYDLQTSKTVVGHVLLDKFVYDAECDESGNIN